MKLTGIRQKVFLDRYALRDREGNLVEKTPEEMWRRVARGIAAVEKSSKREGGKSNREYWQSEFYRVMEDFKFVPGGRILSGAGTDYQVTYFNCFVIPSPKDSREGILDSLKQLVEIQSRSGGVGLNLSSLRPRGARVRKVNGTSSGPVTWAGLFSYATHDVVQQGGTRRGATMLMLWDWHPDIEEFITVKQDLSKINGANLSVCISDAFMEAVKADRDWDLVYPDIEDERYDKAWDGDIVYWKKLGGKVKIHKTVKAKELWNLICEAAWRSAEPGLHFLERSNSRSNTWSFENLIATNPCVTGDALVATAEGLVRMKEVVESHFEGGKRFGGNMSLIIDKRTIDPATTGTTDGRAFKFFNNGIKDVLKLATKSGYELTATLDHKVLTSKGWIELSSLKLGDRIMIQSGEGKFSQNYDLGFISNKESRSLPTKWTRELGQVLGWLIGDGWIRTGDKNCRVGFTFGKDDQETLIYFKNILNAWYGKDIKSIKRVRNTTHLSYHSKQFVDFFLKLDVKPVKADKKQVPETIYTSPEEAVIGFLQGLFTADGTTNDRGKHGANIRLTSKSKLLLQGVQLLLLHLGIYSRIYNRSRGQREGMFPYVNKKGDMVTYTTDGVLFELEISRQSLSRFILKVGFLNDRHGIKISNIKNKAFSMDKFEDTVSEIIPAGKQTVYDLTEEKSYTFITNGIVSYDCGEQPLGAWAVCNLGAMNLSEYVKDGDLTKDKAGKFDYESFGRDTRVAMRLLDNVIDQTYYFFKENEKCAKDIRRTGLGIMGLGDALIKMKIRYGSEESLPVIEKIFATLRDNAYEVSSDMAAEKGSFPKFDREKYLQGYHIKNLPKNLQKKIEKNGIRNAVLLTIAPTGTTSLVSGVTSGIEPVYEFVFRRKWRGGEQTMYHPLYEEWKKAHQTTASGSGQAQEERPSYFVSANDLTPLEHVKVQAVAQRYIDSSISKTVNAPNSHTVEDVKTLYMASYDMGLKGVTYMRDGSRMGVLERVDVTKKTEDASAGLVQAKQDVVQQPVIRRPAVVQGYTYETKTPFGNAFITINNDASGNPFELFITIGKSGSDVAGMAEALGRMISLTLRMQSVLPPRERMRQVIGQLSGIGGLRAVGFGENRIKSLPDAVGKVLAQHFEFVVNGIVKDAHKQQEIAGQMGLANGSNTVGNAEASYSNGNRAMATGVIAPVHPDTNVQEQKSAAAEQLMLKTTTKFDICPSCGGASLAFEEGCKKCYGCGYSEC